jgi:hypothetical protein
MGMIYAIKRFTTDSGIATYTMHETGQTDWKGFVLAGRAGTRTYLNNHALNLQDVTDQYEYLEITAIWDEAVNMHENPPTPPKSVLCTLPGPNHVHMTITGECYKDAHTGMIFGYQHKCYDFDMIEGICSNCGAMVIEDPNNDIPDERTTTDTDRSYYSELYESEQNWAYDPDNEE